jgi:NADH-quinone oxidoreductase subunit M
LFVSQSALVLAGLDCTSPDALTGALILWLSSALAFTGLARTVLALEARRGRLPLTRFHGGFSQMPQLATSFLVFGLACTGFPGTLGFIGQELLVDGAVRSFPALGFLTIAASALTGLAVLRMYFSLFCGRPGGIVGLGLRTREGLVFGAVAVLLVVAGVAPRTIVASREQASAAILGQRGVRTGSRTGLHPSARVSSQRRNRAIQSPPPPVPKATIVPSSSTSALSGRRKLSRIAQRWLHWIAPIES